MLKDPLKKLVGKIDINGGDAVIFLLSLLLAFSIWVAHNLSLQYSSVVSVPVVAQSNIDGYAAESSNVQTISARCRTSGFSLLSKSRASRREPIRVFFTPDDLHFDGDDIFSISVNELGGYVNEIFGDNIQLESFVSSQIQFRFPEENHKTIPVVPISSVSYKPQYTSLDVIRIVPDSVVVYGEPLQLLNIDRVYTEAINLQNLSSGASGVARIESPKGRVRLSATEVNYSLDVTRYVEVSRRVPVKVRHVPAGKDLSVFPSEADVVFRCAFPMGSDVTENVVFYVDYNDFAKSINGRCVLRTSDLPASIISYSVDPEVFECIESIGR